MKAPESIVDAIAHARWMHVPTVIFHHHADNTYRCGCGEVPEVGREEFNRHHDQMLADAAYDACFEVAV